MVIVRSLRRWSRCEPTSWGWHSAYEDELSLVDERHRPSVRNLLQYVALRDHDLRGCGRAGSPWLSSLGRSEGHVVATIDAVLARFGVDAVTDGSTAGVPTMAFSRELLRRHTIDAVGPLAEGDVIRLMGRFRRRRGVNQPWSTSSWTPGWTCPHQLCSRRRRHVGGDGHEGAERSEQGRPWGPGGVRPGRAEDADRSAWRIGLR